MRFPLLVALIAFGCACGSGPVSPGIPPGNQCPEASRPECTVCCSDQSFQAQCTDGAWACPDPSIDSKLCLSRSCAPPPSSRAPCVDRDAGMLLGCGANEVCFTSLSCASDNDGGMSCTDVDGGAGDDRCHAQCNFFDQCPAGESCSTDQNRICTF